MSHKKVRKICLDPKERQIVGKNSIVVYKLLLYKINKKHFYKIRYSRLKFKNKYIYF